MQEAQRMTGALYSSLKQLTAGHLVRSACPGVWSSMYCGSEAMSWQALRVVNGTDATGSHWT